MLLLPRASSLMAISASLMRLLVLVFSAREAVVLVSATAVGGWFTSITGPEATRVVAWAVVGVSWMLPALSVAMA